MFFFSWQLSERKKNSPDQKLFSLSPGWKSVTLRRGAVTDEDSPAENLTVEFFN